MFTQTNDSDVMFLEMWSDLEELLRGKVDLVSDGQYCHIYWNDAMSVYHKHRVIDNKDGDFKVFVRCNKTDNRFRHII